MSRGWLLGSGCGKGVCEVERRGSWGDGVCGEIESRWHPHVKVR